MRKTIARFKTSIVALLGDPAITSGEESQVEAIRAAMLAALSCIDANENMRASKAWADIARAADVQTLWYLRSDVLRLLSVFHGEQMARNKLQDMTELFRGLVSANQMPSRRRIER